MKSVFADVQQAAFPFQYSGQIVVGRLVGGIPNNEKVAEGWLRKKMAASDEVYLQELLATTMLERNVTKDEAAKIVRSELTVNGFKRDDEGLYIEGRQLKAALKEMVSVAIAADKIEQRGWGKTKKFLNGFLAEHVFVVEERLHIARYKLDDDGEPVGDPEPVTEPDGTLQQFVHTHHGDSIKYEEFVDHAALDFTVICDFLFTPEEWQALWLVGELQGVGASRSQGFGTYAVTRWDRIALPWQKVTKVSRGKATAAEGDGADETAG